MTVTAILGIIAALIPIIWVLINRGATKQGQANDLRKHSIRELYIGTQRVRALKPKPPV